MTHEILNNIGEEIYSHVLSNGLKIFYIPKPNFSKTFAMLATNFGSADQKFQMQDGAIINTPAGVAHFLEHKMFEDEDGNALQKFAKTGASPNAFTSRNMTAYYFSCTDNFYENLNILTKFVCTPYFTTENVKKEKGIIEQEIKMLDDDPFWNAYTNVYAGMYHEHPIRISIAGSAESIATIEPDLLYTCHKAFYSPKNLVLTVCGNADFSKIIEIAEKNTPKQADDIAKRFYGNRNEFVNKSEITVKMNVSQPLFMIGIKDEPLYKNESASYRQLVGELCCELIAGKSSELYSNLYKNGTLNRRFDASYTLHPDAACVLFSGDSKNPKLVCDEIFKEICKISENGISPDEFERVKRMHYGMLIRSLDQPDDLCRMQCESTFYGENFSTISEQYDKIKTDDLLYRFKIWQDKNKITLSQVIPLDSKQEG